VTTVRPPLRVPDETPRDRAGGDRDGGRPPTEPTGEQASPAGSARHRRRRACAVAIALLLALPAIPLRATDGAPAIPQRATDSAKATPLPAVSPVASAVAGDLLPAEQPGAVPVSLVVSNLGLRPDRLLGGESPVAERIEPVASEGFGARRRRRRLGEGIEIPTGATVFLEPGGTHLLLVGLRRDLIQGQTMPLVLRFAEAGEVAVTARVRRRLDAAGVAPIPPATAGGIVVSLVSVPPAVANAPPAATGERRRELPLGTRAITPSPRPGRPTTGPRTAGGSSRLAPPARRGCPARRSGPAA